MARSDNSNAPADSSQKTHALISASAILIVVAASLAIFVPQFFTNLDRLIARHPYVSFNPWDLPFFVGVPTFLALVYGIGLRVFNQANEKRIDNVLKVALVFAIVAALTRMVYGIGMSQHLTSLGYSSCWSLSSPSVMSATVWVKKSRYCIENAGAVRKPLLRWIDERAAAGEPIAAEEVRAQAEQLLLDWESQR